MDLAPVPRGCQPLYQLRYAIDKDAAASNWLVDWLNMKLTVTFPP
jgi:hypothetical protein